MQLNSIGIVKTSVKDGIDNNWGNVVSEIHIKEELADGLKGLEEFSNIIS